MKKLAYMLCAAFLTMSFSTVSASHSHWHHHKQDNYKPRFNIPLPGDTLTATVDIVSGIFTGPTGSTVTPYVSTPDGFVQQGTATLLSDLPAVVVFPTVSPVVAGTYTYGLLVNGSGIDLGADTLPVIVSSTTSGISTTTYIYIPSSTLTTTESQFNAAFVYNAPAFP